MAIANLASLIDPEIVVLGGTVADARDLMLEPIRRSSRAGFRRRSPADCAFAISALGDDAVAIGAARLAMVAGRS